MRAFLALSLFTATAFADPAPPKLAMKGHDMAIAIYADKCANGASNDEANRKAFIANMVADKSSKLGKEMTKLQEPDYEVVLSDWTQSFHLRDGCGDNYNSFSAFLLKRSTMGNSHELFLFAVVTIDDDVNSEKRTLSLRSITTVAGRKAAP